MKYTLPVVAALVVAPGIAAAQEDSTVCTLGELTRRVVIMAEPGVSVPCEVHYFKDTEAPGESQVLWSAAAQEGYCEQQAAGFVAKLEGWGWSCSAAAAPATPTAPAMEEAPAEQVDEPAMEAPAMDDSEALEPASAESE